MEYIVHICTFDNWQIAQKDGLYQADSLTSEGFIHCSRPDQALGVANRYFNQVPDLVLLWIDLDKVETEIRWEPSEGEVYPHLYGALKLDAVLAVRDLHPDPDGLYRTLPEL